MNGYSYVVPTVQSLSINYYAGNRKLLHHRIRAQNFFWGSTSLPNVWCSHVNLPVYLIKQGQKIRMRALHCLPISSSFKHVLKVKPPKLYFEVPNSVGILMPFILGSIYILLTVLAIFWLPKRLKKEINN